MSYQSVDDRDALGDDADREAGGSMVETKPDEMTKLQSMLRDNWINALLVFVPAGMAVPYLGCSPTTVFIVNFVAMIVSFISVLLLFCPIISCYAFMC